MRRRQYGGEAGFTLVELLVAIVILGIIAVPLGASAFLGLRTADETSNRFASSNDAQLLSIWLPPDVQSAGNQSGDVVTSGNTECSGVTNVLRLRWRETQGTTNTYVAAYAVSLNANTGVYELKRYFCVNSGASTTHVVARNLASATAATATVATTKVSVTVTSKGTATSPSGYVYSVSGYRRTP
jgi:prepilin-type N-terminal cleavage/methylation domain-containing protein